MRRLSQVLCKNRLYQFMPHQLSRRVVLLEPHYNRRHVYLESTGDEKVQHSSFLVGCIFEVVDCIGWYSQKYSFVGIDPYGADEKCCGPFQNIEDFVIRSQSVFVFLTF